jgi:hypothetical protein
MSGTRTAPRSAERLGAAMAAGRSEASRLRRGPGNATVLDLIFRVTGQGRWPATLRNDPSVVLVAGSGEELSAISRGLAVAILQGHGAHALQAMRAAGQALPAPEAGQEEPATAPPPAPSRG